MHRFPRSILSVLTLLFTLSVLGGVSISEALADQRPASTVLQYEVVEPLTTSSSALSDEDTEASDQLEISLYAYGRRFDLALEPNPLFSNDATNIWVGGQSQTSESPNILLYKGVVKDEPGSWVRVSLRDGSLDGMIWTQGEIYFLEPGTRFFAGVEDAPQGTVIYRMSDTASMWDLGSCALEMPSVGFNMEGHGNQHNSSANALDDYNALRSDLQESAGSGTLKQLDIALVADYEYYQEHGASSAADMQNILNQIDGIYQSEVGVKLNIAGTVVFTTSADPFSNTLDSYTLLQEFSNYRGATSGVVHTAGLAHLFTNRDIDSNVIGIAWIGALCSSYYGAGLSQDYINENKSLVLLTAHEIGHNFNAPHDNQSGSVCSSTPFGYIMNPWVSTSLSLQFSTCSKNQMAPEIAGASCLSTVSDGEPPAPTCSYSINPSSRAHTAPAATGTVAVTTGDSCDWTAGGNAGWITVTGGGSGTGNGTVSYAITANPGPSSRSGTMTIAGRTFTITQAAPCTYTLSSYSRTFSKRSGRGSISVRTSSTCGWTATSNANWITITRNPSGTGRKTLYYSVTPNTTGGVRTGTLTVAGQTFTVTQNK